jgi:hypothetical protein
MITKTVEGMAFTALADDLGKLWEQYQEQERRHKQTSEAKHEAGILLGKELYRLRADSEVVSGGTTFRGTLDQHGIPHSTAYRWIAKYEIEAGIRQSQTAVHDPDAVEDAVEDPCPASEFRFEGLHPLRSALNILRMASHQIDELDTPRTLELVRGFNTAETRELLIASNKAMAALKALTRVLQEKNKRVN